MGLHCINSKNRAMCHPTEHHHRLVVFWLVRLFAHITQKHPYSKWNTVSNRNIMCLLHWLFGEACLGLRKLHHVSLYDKPIFAPTTLGSSEWKLPSLCFLQDSFRWTFLIQFPEIFCNLAGKSSSKCLEIHKWFDSVAPGSDDWLRPGGLSRKSGFDPPPTVSRPYI